MPSDKKNEPLPWQKTYRVSNKKLKFERMDKVLRLTLDNKNQDQICKEIGVQSRMTVYRIQQELVKVGKLTKDQITGTIDKTATPKQQADRILESQKTDEFFKEPMIIKWQEWYFGKHDKNIPHNVKAFRKLCNAVFTVCKTLKIHPESIVFALDASGQPDFVNALTDAMNKFKEHVSNGTVQYAHRKGIISHDNDTLDSLVPFSKAFASLLDSHSKSLPKQQTNSIIGRSKKNYGDYSEVYLTDNETTKLLPEFFKKEGYDFGYYAIAVLMPEIISRSQSILDWVVQYQTEFVSVDDKQYEIFLIPEFYESKTKSYWTKQVIAPTAKKVLSELPKGKPIFESLKGVADKLNDYMTEFYISIGKLDESARLPVAINGVRNANRKFYKIGSQSYYYDKNKVYALRHTGAHMWMRRTGYRAEIVARMGWEDVATLVQAYAKMPTSFMWQASTCYYCNPPPLEVREKSQNQYFDSPAHALAYLNNGNQPRPKKDESEYLQTIKELSAKLENISLNPTNNITPQKPVEIPPMHIHDLNSELHHHPVTFATGLSS